MDKGLAVGMTVTGIGAYVLIIMTSSRHADGMSYLHMLGFASYDGVSGQLVLSSSPQFRIIICFETLAEYIEKYDTAALIQTSPSQWLFRTLADRGLLRKSAVVFGAAAACALGYVAIKRYADGIMSCLSFCWEEP